MYNANNYFNAATLRSILLKSNNKKDAEFLNTETNINLLDLVHQIYTARFRWNLEELGVDDNYIEQILFFRGFLVFYKDKKYGNLLLPAHITSYNVYNQPLTATIEGNDYSKEVEIGKEAIILRDSSILKPAIINSIEYIRKIADVRRSCEVYVKAMKKPLIFAINQDKKKSVDVFYNKFNTNENYIMINSKLFEDINYYQDSTHNSADLKGLYDYEQSLFYELLKTLGISTVQTEKKAQMTDDEIHKNDSFANIILNQNYDCRKSFCKKISEFAKINITCEIAQDLNSIKIDDIKSE